MEGVSGQGEWLVDRFKFDGIALCVTSGVDC